MEISLFIACLCMSVLCGYPVTASVTQEDIWHRMQWVRQTAIPDVVPVHGGPVSVTLGLELISVREVDTARGEVEIMAWRSLIWRDPALAWLGYETSHIRNGNQNISRVDKFSMDIKYLWTPDIVAYDPVHAPELLSPPLAIVAADGTVLYIPNERIRFRCDLEHFETAQGSNCTLQYGPWTYSALLVGLDLADVPISTVHYREDSRFDLLATYAEIETKHYACCPEPYEVARFTLNIRRKVSGRSLFGRKK